MTGRERTYRSARARVGDHRRLGVRRDGYVGPASHRSKGVAVVVPPLAISLITILIIVVIVLIVLALFSRGRGRF
jgi:hypothetical protein